MTNVLLDAADLSLLVLCGGEARRMGGVDKPLVIYAGKPMVDQVLASAPAVTEVLISANRSLDDYARRGTVVTDRSAGIGGQSPLLGIYAGLLTCTTPWLLVSPGDTPRLPRRWGDKMIDASQGQHNVVAHDGERQQHLHLLLRRDVVDDLRAFLESGQYEVYRWLENLDLVRAQFSNPDAFINVNKEADLR